MSSKAFISDPWRIHGDALILSVRLAPKSARDEITGIETLADGHCTLKVRVRPPPQEGEANAVLIRLIAKALRIPASAVVIEAGATGRVKTLSLQGDPEQLANALAEFVADPKS